MTGPLWTEAECPLDDGSPAVVALAHLLDVCAAEGRCFVYHGPVNPDGMGSFEPGLLPRFRALVARMVAERRVPYGDYTDALPASAFRTPLMARPDAIHLNQTGRAWLATRLAQDVHTLVDARAR